MVKMQPVISAILLTVYLIVMGHHMVPHHHHEKSFSDKCCREALVSGNMDGQTELCANNFCHHHNEGQAPCHFEVKPVPGKSVVLSSYAILTVVLQQLYVPEEEQFVWPGFRLSYFQDPCLHTFGLRGPPSIV
jgi:hypothetical protein